MNYQAINKKVVDENIETHKKYLYGNLLFLTFPNDFNKVLSK